MNDVSFVAAAYTVVLAGVAGYALRLALGRAQKARRVEAIEAARRQDTFARRAREGDDSSGLAEGEAG